MKITLEFDTDVECYENKEMLRAIHAADLALTVWQYQTLSAKLFNTLLQKDNGKDAYDCFIEVIEYFNALKIDINELID